MLCSDSDKCPKCNMQENSSRYSSHLIVQFFDAYGTFSYPNCVSFNSHKNLLSWMVSPCYRDLARFKTDNWWSQTHIFGFHSCAMGLVFCFVSLFSREILPSRVPQRSRKKKGFSDKWQIESTDTLNTDILNGKTHLNWECVHHAFLEAFSGENENTYFS